MVCIKTSINTFLVTVCFSIVCFSSASVNAFSLGDLDDYLDDAETDIQNEIDTIEQQIEELEEGQTPTQALQNQIDENAQDILALAENVKQNISSELSNVRTDTNNQSDQVAATLEEAILKYDDKKTYYESLAKAAGEQGQASLENAYEEMANAWALRLSQYEAELESQYQTILEDITTAEESNIVLIGQSAQFENVEEVDDSSPQLYPNSSVGLSASSDGYIIPFNYTFSDWAQVSMAAPYSNGTFKAPLLTLGVFVNDWVFDYIGVRGQVLADDESKYGYGIKLKERLEHWRC
ncbi:hypothetical protein [Marinomonas mediterranea]|uniref:hypothetical protein n=1 Tax=Marinomonas mediterranea TaxID=119864 RepID=UPI00234A62C8|nr:hypothetical protein [Marinomonas mediterranea]WCN09478.1 hypothetical protein GV055_11300 [Marinomonas mediterranea]